MAQHKRFKKRGLNIDHNIFVYFGAEAPNHWYVSIGGLETSKFPHGISLSPSFPSREKAEEYKKSVAEYLAKAFKINFKK